MARLSRTGGKASKAKARKAKPRKPNRAKGRPPAKAGTSKTKASNTKQRVIPAKPGKPRSVADLTKELNEAREQQAASAEILAVINSSKGDLTPVFDIVLEKAHSLCGVTSGSLQLLDGDQIRAVAVRGMTGSFEKVLRQGFRVSDRLRQSIKPDHPVHTPDLVQLLATAPNEPAFRAAVELENIRTTLSVALAKDGVPLGRIVAARKEVRPFTGKQIALLQGFANQAVIAIENARLFNEVQVKTRDLTEALAHQTGSSNVLRVIAASPTDIKPVLEAIVESARELCEANDAIVLLKDGDDLRFSSHSGPIPVKVEKWPIGRGWTAGLAFLDQKPVHVRDMLSDEGAAFPDARKMGQSTGATVHTVLSVPLLLENESIGAILLRRTEVRPFNGKQINLLQTFADQAVIAVENARLFNEVQARTRDLSESLQQQTATADVLKVISRSTFDLQTVLETLIKSAVELSGANRGSIFLREGDVFPLKAASHTTPEFLQYWAANPPRAGRGSATNRVIASGKVEIIPDVLQDPEMQMPPGALARIRATLGVPMLRDDKVEGVLVMTRPEPGLFSQSQIDLVQTFADQAVIAVENVRLFDETQTRARELAASLEELRTAQDRLIQTEKLASLGQLTAGIAHEIKNPLNFVNNFSSLSAELIDELDEALAPAPLDQKTRDEVGELTAMLKANLEKVVQHGKRADSIVRNMLLHSREGSGEHRAADINGLVEESLNLAYHGARAETPAFNVTLIRDLDPEAGAVDLYPQEITRALLNFITNGFYATTRRKAEVADESFEPALQATTKNLGKSVEIRIRDNGTGIPPEVREKMFNPFFTTKPAGEGTGLGLSMSHDIIVKQHGGRIDVETEPGAFTEFIITLPRVSPA